MYTSTQVVPVVLVLLRRLCMPVEHINLTNIISFVSTHPSFDIYRNTMHDQTNSAGVPGLALSLLLWTLRVLTVVKGAVSVCFQSHLSTGEKQVHQGPRTRLDHGGEARGQEN